MNDQSRSQSAGGAARGAFYITTPIYYVNDAPHIGHAYTTIVADVLARYHRLFGDETFFLTGTDEHGQKVERAAKARGKTPQEHCDEFVERFKATWERLNISHNRFIRTTEDQHKELVQALLQKVYDAGDIYLDEYTGYYHVADETFVTAENVSQADIESGDVVELSEKNYFFRQSKYQKWLVEYIEENPTFIIPESRRNWVLGQLREPLKDLCISRPKERLNWGIELPFDSDYVCYVWFDALINYLTGIDYFSGKPTPPLWPEATHLIGKDILQHHAIYWPIMLKALHIEQPRHIIGHGWWMGNEGEKISKRRAGSGAWLWLADDYGPDAFRYFLIREMILGLDSNISEELFIQRINGELVNDLGNLVSRAGKMVVKQFAGELPPGNLRGEPEKELLSKAEALCEEIVGLVDGFQTQAAAERIAAFVKDINVYFDRRTPWSLAKDPQRRDELAAILRTSLEATAVAAALLSPIMPEKTQEIFGALGDTVRVDEVRVSGLQIGAILQDGARVKLEAPIFPRIDKPRQRPAKAEPTAAHAAAKAQEEGAGLISIDDFFKAELRTAVVAAAETVEGSDKLLKLRVDDGSSERQLVAGIAKDYAADALVGKRVVIVANLKPAKIFGIESQGMLLAAKRGKKLTLLTTDDPEFKPGAKVS